MRSTRVRLLQQKCLEMLMILAVGWSLSAQYLTAQSAGNNTVYSTSTTVTGSSSFIDASVFASPTADICATLYSILSSSPAAGTVIDARGINSTNSKMVCATGTSPWYNGTTYLNVTSYLLLPAGTITIPYPWILPNRTRLVGEGASNAGQSGTVIQACTTSITGCSINFSTSNAMIQMGDSNCGSNCFGISVENLMLNGNGLALTGILNNLSQELTYVDHVTLYQITGTGLSVQSGSGAQNGGPFTNIRFDTGGSTPATTTVCVDIDGVATRGVHGLTCLSNGTPNNAVLIDGSDNSLEDIQIDGFNQDGILVGSRVNSFSNVIFNVTGGNCSGSCSMKNVIHIDNAFTVSHLSISQVTKNGATNAIEDDESLTATSPVTDSMVGIYVLGEPFAGGYSRFTTSLHLPSWLIGSTVLAGTPVCSSNGGLYTKTSGITGTTLWVCVAGKWTPVI